MQNIYLKTDNKSDNTARLSTHFIKAIILIRII